jgi:hypothetical protein
LMASLLLFAITGKPAQWWMMRAPPAARGSRTTDRASIRCQLSARSVQSDG